MPFELHGHPGIFSSLRPLAMEHTWSALLLKKKFPRALLCFFVAIIVYYKALNQHQDIVSSKPLVHNQNAPALAPEEIDLPIKECLWGGWETIEKMFIFGDSWSDTGFNYLGEQPSLEQPLGNPSFPGDLETNGAKWPVHLTTAFNDSQIRTYNFACSGAFINRRAWNVTNCDFIDEFESQFHRDYVEFDFGQSDWVPETTLFVVFVGINDNMKIYDLGNEGRQGEGNGTQEVLEARLKEYKRMVEKIYLAGARNFLIMNVPPVGRPIESSALAEQVPRWNKHLANLVSDFRGSHPRSTIFEFDTFGFVNQIIDDPSVFRATEHYKNTTKPCLKYRASSMDLNLFDEECSFALGEYLWHDNLHPTMPVHKALASQLAEFLRNQKHAKVPEDVGTKEGLGGTDLRRSHPDRPYRSPSGEEGGV